MVALLINKVVKKIQFKRVIIFVVTFILIFMTIASSPNLSTKKYNLKEGDIAKESVKAPREVVDEASTNARIKQVEDSVPIQYSKKTDVKITSINEINQLFSNVNEVKDSVLVDKDKLIKLKAISPIILTDDNFSTLIKLNKDELKNLGVFLIKTLSDLYDNNNIEDNNQFSNGKSLEDIKKAKDSILQSLNGDPSFSKYTDIAVAITNLEIKPNFFYDKESTDLQKINATKKVTPIVIKKDQIIISDGEPVTLHQIEILKYLGLVDSKSNFSWYLYFSLAILILLIMFTQWYYLYKSKTEIFMSWKKLLLINILNFISIILARSLCIISPFLIPLACIPMLMTLLVSDSVSLVICALNCILLSASVGFQLDITILAFFNAILGSLLIKKMHQRNDILFASLFLGVLNILLLFSMGFIISSNILEVTKATGFVFIAVLVSAVLTIGLLPIFEYIFDIVTSIKLLELSNPNNPLLKRLLVEAPGTYHHSILVANLAELAAEEVDANPLLARVAAYYHDIGKIVRPFFFKENQLSENPHNKITPNLSTLIITSHVKDGIELGKANKLPQVILDIIEQHHGTSLVKYFYITMKNTAERPEEVKEEDYKYPGPTPKTKEAGVVMLADGVEAAVRSIADPTKGKVEEMVNKIIKDRLNQGQLDNCDLTLKDLEKIRKSFLKSLKGVYHQRIEYPTEKWAYNTLEERRNV
ncbi:MAG TPA: HDIG domain-containing metalloprotein [Clostridiaceae bacterium]